MERLAFLQESILADLEKKSRLVFMLRNTQSKYPFWVERAQDRKFVFRRCALHGKQAV